MKHRLTYLSNLNSQHPSYHIATLPAPWFFKYDNEYVLAQEPDYIQMHLTKSADGDAYLPTDFIGTARLYYLPEFQRWYEQITEVPGTHVFKRLEVPKQTTPMDNLAAVGYGAVPEQISAAPNESFEVSLEVTNEGTAVWPANGGDGWGVVKLNYKIFPTDNRAQIRQEQRVLLPGDLAPGETRIVTWQINAPDTVGSYEIEIDMLAESILWFSEKGAPKPTIFLIVK